MKHVQRLFTGAVLGILVATSAAAANPTYERKRAIYNEMSRLRGQNAIALAGAIDKRAAHSKSWEAVLQTATKEFGEDHACAKVAQFSRSSWTHMVFAAIKPSASDISAAGSFGYQAGEWAGTCYDEIEKLDAPVAKR